VRTRWRALSIVPKWLHGTAPGPGTQKMVPELPTYICCDNIHVHVLVYKANTNENRYKLARNCRSVNPTSMPRYVVSHVVFSTESNYPLLI